MAIRWGLSVLDWHSHAIDERRHPLTWAELRLQAWHDGEPMTWQVRHDRDAFKELWLLFENDEARFPLYPGESTEIVYSYTVSDIKWGQWFQRAVRLPTQRLSVRLDFPAEIGPSVWGMETSMSAEALPFRTPISRAEDGQRTQFKPPAPSPARRWPHSASSSSARMQLLDEE